MTTEAATENTEYLQKFFGEKPDGYLAGKAIRTRINRKGSEGPCVKHEDIVDVIVFRDIQYRSSLLCLGVYLPDSQSILSKLQLTQNSLVDIYGHSDMHEVNLSTLTPAKPEIKQIVKILRSKESRIKNEKTEPESRLVGELQIKQNRLNAEFFERLFRSGNRPTHEELDTAQKMLEGYRSAFLPAATEALRIGQDVHVNNGALPVRIVDLFPLQNRMLVETTEGGSMQYYVAHITHVTKVRDL